MNPNSEFSDVSIVGAGLSGLVAAKAFAVAGFSVASLGALERGGRGRTVALFGRSIALLKRIGVWPQVEASAAPLRVLRIVDDTGSLFAPGPIDFQCADIGLDAFGWNIEHQAIMGDVNNISALNRNDFGHSRKHTRSIVTQNSVSDKPLFANQLTL